MPENENINWLDSPFPLMENKKQKLISSVAFAAFVYLFLLIFRPFGINLVKMNIPIYLLGFFFITLGVMLISNMILPAILKKPFDPDEWNVKKTIIFNTGIILGIGFFNWLYNHLLQEDKTLDHSLVYFILITFGVGIIPSAFLVLIMENYLRKKNNQIAITFEENITKPIIKVKEDLIKIPSENENDDLMLFPSQLICMRSEGNYVMIYFEEGEKIKSKLQRISMSKLENVLQMLSEFKRCHRSYLANFNKVVHVSGNARNYNLHFENMAFTVPVSRSFPKEVILEVKTN